MDLIKEIISFIIKRGKYWLIPIIILFFLLSGIIYVTQGTALSPFIYTIFLILSRNKIINCYL